MRTHVNSRSAVRQVLDYEFIYISERTKRNVYFRFCRLASLFYNFERSNECSLYVSLALTHAAAI